MASAGVVLRAALPGVPTHDRASSASQGGGVLVHNGGTAATRPRSGRWARCSAVGIWSVFLGFVHVLGRGSR
jgi:hypothetical protein